MGRASSAKKVARAAGTGGGRTARGRRPALWYALILVVLVLGVFLVVISRNQRQEALGSTSNTIAPRAASASAQGDHWHDAFGVYACDKWLADITDQTDPKGIHTHGDGIIHVHPALASSAGKHATLSVFTSAVKMKLSSDSFKLPGDSHTYKNGQLCGDKPAEVSLWSNGQRQTGNPEDFRFRADRGKLVLAFMPKGAGYPGDPPSTPNLDKLTDVAPAGTDATGAGTTVPAGANTPAAPTTVPAAPSTAPAAPSTTAKP